ncbi:UDP-N-acetylmuramate--L-alanine ligase [Paenibacillus polymyxa]|uniref:UDP-N-acetylmuramate--L-alanine ligase n=1 Tax=Paenibacillus polymyxa (strain SC2) TaxID=886882 RepID=E3E9X1_PAEPS|nr:UDP-N-acetylmuramate--L-alanine ligase [Paenibacillus polymyxa]ADO58104.2 UDP-N-acetylmuramate--alanine ligase [Paenibacillus polymyxa SC2]AJE54097.1 UDP-N-acetylmuramate--alanine ligase [Paenibacillus polymyxa]QOH64662.1 UDP-N-acetylmuramate--L-alanine ligase [Paenibacillus polymyxa]WPQ59417.1 UDP-N-acetylmuramate--L-alanine ligase [Paenibacillus polymyxa]CCI70700.1 UDP-N-acetylmuramate-alanine ligase [Paenibacillus polymyxa M1]
MITSEHVHFIGIGGYGMSAIARVMLEMGYTVTGSDVASQELTEKLAAKGAKIYIGHTPEHIAGADIVVYSTALSRDNVERVAAEELNIPTLHRSQMLARLLNERKGIAVAGAHGKTTTSSMIALVMERCNVDPTYIIGGEITNLGTNAKAGKSEFVVAEADESDGSFLQYHPWQGIVTNIEADHLENYDGDFNRLKSAYVQFLSQIRPDGAAIVCADDQNIREMLPQLQTRVITYGVEHEADYMATDIQLGDRRLSFTMSRKGTALGTIELSVPGKHNMYNAMATVISCLEAGIPFDQIAATIVEFHGAKRRFQVLGEGNDILIIDDYAHHPTEIEATISAARATGKRIIAVFQPQRYSRTFFLLDAFSRAFSEANEVIITDIYSPAGEKQIAGVHSSKLVDLIVQNSNANAIYLPTKEAVIEELKDRLQPGDLVLTMGAGDIWKAGDALARHLRGQQV